MHERGGGSRSLIVNADDFGLTEGVNRGIIEAHERGIVTSASLMVRQPAATAAAEYARRHPRLSLGLHIDLGEWAYRDGEWVCLYRVVPDDDAEVLATEVWRQLDHFRRLVGADPTHIDSHQHVHRDESVRPVAAEFARALGVPLRQLSPAVRYCGAFYGQSREGRPALHAITVEGLSATLRALGEGCTELACHPGRDDDLPGTMYRAERSVEVDTLCDPRIRARLISEGITLRSFRGLGRPG